MGCFSKKYDAVKVRVTYFWVLLHFYYYDIFWKFSSAYCLPPTSLCPCVHQLSTLTVLSWNIFLSFFLFDKFCSQVSVSHFLRKSHLMRRPICQDVTQTFFSSPVRRIFVRIEHKYLKLNFYSQICISKLKGHLGCRTFNTEASFILLLYFQLTFI